MKFRTALILGITPVVLGTLAATVTSVQVTLERAARRDLSTELLRARRVFDDLQSYRRSLFASQTRVLAQEPRLKSVMSAAEISHATVYGVALELKKNLGSDLFLITDGAGKLRADTADERAEGFSLIDKPLVSEALNKGDASGVWVDGQNAYQVQARAVSFGTRVVGVVIVGYRIDDRPVEIVHQQTGCKLLVDLNTTVIAAGPVAAKTSVEALRVTAEDAPVEVNLLDGRYLAIAEKWPEYDGKKPLRVVILRSLDEALGPARKLIRILYFILASALAATLLFAFGLSKWLSRPLDALVRFTQQIAAGQVDARAGVAGVDEIQTLGRSMNSMVEEIVEARRQFAIQERTAKELEVARGIQQALVPPDEPFERQHIRLVGYFRPMSQCGGDWWTVHELPDGRVLVVIGDVTGHGLPAAILTGVAKAACDVVRTTEGAGLTVEKLLQGMNMALCESTKGQVMMTCFASIIDTKNRIISYANAGHNPPLLLSRGTDGGTMRPLVAQGNRLGDVMESTFESNSERLAADDTIFWYTDGVIECRNDRDEEFGNKRLKRALLGGRAGDPTRMRDHVVAALGEFHGAVPPNDDVTMVVAVLA